MGVSEMKAAAGACQVVTRDLRRQPLSRHQVSVYDSRRSTNAYYPDFAYRVDVKRKCLQVLSVVGPSKCVQGKQIESASCFNRLQKEGDALCIEEYGKRLGYTYSTSSSTFFTAIFECNFGEDVKWVNPLPFDTGAEDLVMSLARHASEWIAFFQRNISKLHSTNSDHTRLSLVLQLDMINCVTWKHASKMPLEVRFQGSDYANQGAPKKQKGVRYRHDRGKWVAEFNPPGKKNNKISLGEYDNPLEAARAADAGMFCYGSKRGSYNFDDSPRFLQQAPRPVSDDKEAIRKWARDFARLTSSHGMESMPLTSSASSWSDGDSSRCLTYGNTDVTGMLQHSNSSISVSNIPSPFASSYALEYNPSVLEHNSDSSSGLSFSLEDVTDMFTSRDITSREMPVTIEDFEQGVDMPLQGVDMPLQINSSPPPQEPISFPDDNLFRSDGLDQFWSSSPSPQNNNSLIRDGRTVSDDLFQCFMSCYPASTSSGSIQLISR